MSGPVFLCVLSALLLLGPSAQASLPPPDTSYNFLMMLLLLGPSVQASLPPPDTSYNFLMMLPATSQSHRNVFMPLATELTKRGHKVTMMSPLPPADTNPNITYINKGLLFDPKKINMFQIRDDFSLLMGEFTSDLVSLVDKFYSDPEVVEVYNDRKKFDLIVFDWSFNEFVYPFAYEQSFISITSTGMDHVKSATLGNLQNPAYVLAPFFPFQHPLSFFERVLNTIVSILLPIWWRNFEMVPRIQKEVNKHFPNLPPLLEIERNISLSLFNSHYALDMVLPLLPTQVEVGGMHCRPGQPLPNELKHFMSGQPTVYFSLGTIAKGSTMPQRFQQIILSVFAKLPYKILWKYDAVQKDMAQNVMTKKWMAQQDILADPNVKLFISHCGRLSSQEAMYHGKPVLGLPIFADQFTNAKMLADRGVGKMLIWEQLTEQLFEQTIIELVENKSYLQKASAISSRINDQLQPPVERAVYWSEYVIRHQGATHLRSPELDLTWRELLHLDILFVLHVLLYLLYRIVKSIVRMCCGDRKRSTKKKRE